MADRSAGGGPTDRWRSLMATEFDEETYGQRWQVETVMFMLKQHQGAALTAHTYHTRRREMGLMAVTHNILILRLIKLFYRALPSPFLAPSAAALPDQRSFGLICPSELHRAGHRSDTSLTLETDGPLSPPSPLMGHGPTSRQCGIFAA